MLSTATESVALNLEIVM